MYVVQYCKIEWHLGVGLIFSQTSQYDGVQVLDAPALQDDFYLNLVDWSSQNTLAVGLGSCVYLWSACTSKVNTKESRALHMPCDLAGHLQGTCLLDWS